MCDLAHDDARHTVPSCRVTGSASLAPLLARFPALATIPRVALGTYPTPVQRLSDAAAARLAGQGTGPLWIKRDDLGAEPLGGNKVRALELLLAAVEPGDRVLTVGARGSTHALATAIHANRLGASTTVVRWTQAMNADARRTARRLGERASVIDVWTPVEAIALATLLRARRNLRWVPAGGTSPVGILGHVNAGLELADQIDAGELPEPDRVVVPLGTGGTAAGLLLGFAIAGLATEVVGARVVPRIIARRARVLHLVRRAAALIERRTGAELPRPGASRLRIVHDVYGGAYGRPTRRGTNAAECLREEAAIPLDATYAAKAAAALRSIEPTGPALFWLTFDGRWMGRNLPRGDP